MKEIDFVESFICTVIKKPVFQVFIDDEYCIIATKKQIKNAVEVEISLQKSSEKHYSHSISYRYNQVGKDPYSWPVFHIGVRRQVWEIVKKYYELKEKLESENVCD